MDTTKAGRDIGPDILRALAILLVMAWHMPGDNLPPAFTTYWGQFGWLGVDVFFVLSGYLIGTELLKPVHKGDAPNLVVFYIKRFFRILPAYWLILAIYVLIPGWREGPTMAPAWKFLTFTMSFGLDVSTQRAFSHAWSLCAEEHFYLVLPALVLLLRKLGRPWPPIALGLALIAGGMVLRHTLWIDWKTHTEGETVLFMKAIYYPSYTRFDGLIMGVGLAALRLWYPQAWVRFAKPLFTLPLAALCLGATLYMNVVHGFVLTELGSVIFYPLFGLGVALLLAAILELERYLQPLRRTGLGFIAAISYSLYLSQKLVFHADQALLPASWLHGWGAVIIYYVTAIAVAAVMYWAVERTSLILRNRVLARLSRYPASPVTITA